MNGDYYHFVKDENQCIGIAIADVIGKGIPAALSMSMIKYAMDSLPDNRHNPGLFWKVLIELLSKMSIQVCLLRCVMGSMTHGNIHSAMRHAGHEPAFTIHAESRHIQRS